MVTKTERCSFTEFRIVPGRGRRFIAKDGRVHHIWGSKARCLFHRKIKPVKLTWTLAWRAFNKKIKIDESTRRRTKKVARVQKAVVGMSLDEIKRRKAESREDRGLVCNSSAVHLTAMHRGISLLGFASASSATRRRETRGYRKKRKGLEGCAQASLCPSLLAR